MPAFINSADLVQSIIPETVFKTTPTTAATRYELPVKVDGGPLAFKRDEIKSDTKRPNRASNGKKLAMGKADGTWEFRLTKAAVFDTLLQSAFSGTFATGVLKAGQTDSTFSHIVKEASNMFVVTPGCVCNSVTIAGKQNDVVTASFAVTGADRLNNTTDNALTLTSYGSQNEYVGSDVATVTIAGVTLAYTEFSVTVSHPKTARGVFGSTAVQGYALQGNREVTVTLKAYRGDFTLDTLVNTGVPAKVTITIGGAADGWKITVPLADANYPEDSVDNGSLMQTVVLTGRYDDTTSTDVQIERL